MQKLKEILKNGYEIRINNKNRVEVYRKRKFGYWDDKNIKIQFTFDGKRNVTYSEQELYLFLGGDPDKLDQHCKVCKLKYPEHEMGYHNICHTCMKDEFYE
jgi:hypothetical protein